MRASSHEQEGRAGVYVLFTTDKRSKVGGLSYISNSPRSHGQVLEGEEAHACVRAKAGMRRKYVLAFPSSYEIV